MWDMLYAFGIGISFSVGVMIGATLCRIATKEGRKDMMASVEAHNKMVEERLSKSIFQHTRIADSLSHLVDIGEENIKNKK